MSWKVTRQQRYCSYTGNSVGSLQLTLLSVFILTCDMISFVPNFWEHGTMELGFNFWLGLVWFVWVKWHINYCRLSKAKSCLYIYIKYRLCKHILLITFLNEHEIIFFFFLFFFFFVHSKMVSSITIKNEYFYSLLIICLNTVEWFQVLLCNTNNLKSVNCLHTCKWIYTYDL